MKIIRWFQLALLAILPGLLFGTLFVQNSPRYLSFLKRSDIAGIGRILDVSDNVLRMEVDHYWLGSQGTNVIEIERAFLEACPDLDSIVGNAAVFFAMTNKWKNPPHSSTLPVDFEDSWEFSFALTNCGPACPPRFAPANAPPLFIIGSNDVEVVNFFSNFVESVFITRDHGLYYRTLRDALRSESSAMLECRSMSFLPMFSILSHGSETNLVEMLYDPLFPNQYRYNTLFQLQKKYGWPATNTVPEP
ncbi:MAG: hypothetical protein ACOX9C_11970 [Kiritimatiellia bacterium]|jgi:hypothetical protein